MRLIVTDAKEKHSESCTTLAVSLYGDILSGGDDCVLRRWNASGEALGVVHQFNKCITVISWIPGIGGAARRGRVIGGGSSSSSGSNAQGALTGSNTINKLSSNGVGVGGGGGGGDGRDNCVIGCEDGTLTFLNVASGRVERVIEAHTGGSVTRLLYTPDATSILTSGEDGYVKVWSSSGIARSTLASSHKPIYTLCWGNETSELGGDCVLYSCVGEIIIKPLNPSLKKQIKWHAHNGVVLCADWSTMSNLIVTGGEDGLYKVWDPYGRVIFTGSAYASHQPVTSIRFAADGELFAVGSFASIRVCDKTGWSHTNERVPHGSALALEWLPDGTQIVLACGNGVICTAQLIDRSITWDEYTVTLTDSRTLRLYNTVNDSVHELVQRDRVLRMDMGYDKLVVCTTTTCTCYSLTKLDSPIQFDLRDAIVTLLLCPQGMLLADCTNGIQLYSYEGRLMTTVRLQATLRPEILSSEVLAFAADTVAIRNPSNNKQILFYDTHSGKLNEKLTMTHNLEIASIRLSQNGSMQDRKVAFVDRNRDLYLAVVMAIGGGGGAVVQSSVPGSGNNSTTTTTTATATSSSNKSSSPSQGALIPEKLATMVSSVAWHDTHETLVAITDGVLTTWFYPAILYVDRDLMPLTKEVRDNNSSFNAIITTTAIANKGNAINAGSEPAHTIGGVINEGEEFGRNDRIIDIHETKVQIRRGSDGALLTFTISPYPIVLLRLVQNNDWESAMRLARFMKQELLWAILVAAALRTGELNVVEIGYGALNDLAKVRYIHSLKTIPSVEGRQAELALFQHRPAEAERILLQAGLVYRAIDMQMRLFNWERALAIATERKTHVDTVLYRRQKYLEELNKRETIEDFRMLNESMELDEKIIDDKVRQELAKEAERPMAMV